MADWEDAKSTPLVEKNLKQYASLEGGYASGDVGYTHLKDDEGIHKELVAAQAQKGAWEDAKGQWEDAKGTHSTWDNIGGVGAAALDYIGGIPGAIVGTVHGGVTALEKGSAKEGLKAATEFMHKATPSTLLNIDTDNPGYEYAMKPLEWLDKGLTKIGKGYGEIAKLVGAEDGTQEEIAAGVKLAFMGGMLKSGAKTTERGTKEKAAADFAEQQRKMQESVPEPTIKATNSFADEMASNDRENIKLEAERRNAAMQAEIEAQHKANPAPERLAQQEQYDAAQQELAAMKSEEQARLDQQNGQGDLLNVRGNEVPYDLSLVERGQERPLPDPVPVEPKSPNIDRLSLEEPNPYSPHEARAPEPVRDTPQMVEAFKKAQEDAAYKQHYEQQLRNQTATRDSAYDLDIAHKAGELDFQDAPKSPEHRFLENAPETALEKMYGDAYERWRDAGYVDGAARDTMNTITDIRVQRQLKDLAAKNQNTINDIFPGYKNIPEGTTIEFEYQGETHRGKVIGSKAIKTVYGTQFLPIVEHPTRPGRSLKLFESNLKTVFGGPKLTDYQHATKAKDTSLMGESVTSHMVESLRSGDVVGALRQIFENHANAGYKGLAEFLMDRAQGIRSLVHDHSVMRAGDRDVTGYFDPTNNTVGFSGRGAVSPHTVLHEVVHALTSQFLRVNPNHVLSMGVKSIYNQMSALPGFKAFSHITNVREFVAEGFSNPKFQEFLKKQRIENTGATRTAWGRFVDGVKNMLGLKKTEMVNALDHTMDIGAKVMDASTPKFRMEASKTLRDAGIPNKLADLMATERRPEAAPETGPNGARAEAISRMSPTAQALKDFIPEKFPMKDIIEAARKEPDIDQNFVQKGFNHMTSGGLWQSLKVKNLLFKKVYETMNEGSDRAQTLINKYVKDKDTGVLPAARKMTKEEATGAVMNRIIADTEQRPITSDDLARSGMSEAQITWTMKAKGAMDAALRSINAARAAAGKKPINERLGYAVSKTYGDFRRPVFAEKVNAAGETSRSIIGFIGANTRWQLEKIMKQVQEARPEFIIGEEKFMGKGAYRDLNGTRQSKYREAMQLLEDNNPDAANLHKVLTDSYVGDAYDYMNAKKHTMAKKGIFGAEGRKAWESAEENATNFMKAEVTYLETMFKWGELSKSNAELTPLMTDEGIKQPNAKNLADRYIDQAMGVNPSKVGQMVNDLVGAIGDRTGLGSTNIQKVGQFSKAATNTVLLSLNPAYLAANLIQPFQGMPKIKAILQSQGLHLNFDFGTGYSYLARGAITALHDFTDRGFNKLSKFEQDALMYGQEHHVFGNDIIDHSTQVQKNAAYIGSKISEFGINTVESGTNKMVFLSMAHMLHDAGMKTHEGLFETSYKLTKMIMHDYRSQEASSAFNILGPFGSVTKNLTKYKLGEMSQMAYVAREAAKTGDGRPLAVNIAAQIAFAGVTGVMFYNEADQIYQMITKALGKPDTLSRVVIEHMPEWLSHGLPSLIGLDTTQRLGNADAIPDSLGKAAFGGGSKLLDIAVAGKNAVMNPSEMNTKRLVREASPGIATGMMDRAWFSKDINGQETGMSRRPSDTHNIRTYDPRNDADKFWKSIGATGSHEAIQKLKDYNYSTIANNYTDLRKQVISNLADDLFVNGRLDQAKLEAAKVKYMKYEGDPSKFVGDINTEFKNQNLTNAQRQDLANLQNGVTGLRQFQRRHPR